MFSERAPVPIDDNDNDDDDALTLELPAINDLVLSERSK